MTRSYPGQNPARAPLQKMEAHPLARHGDAALGVLVAQRRVFNRLDWWTPQEWLHSDAFVAVSAPGAYGVAGAMLNVPVSFADLNALGSARSTVAWLRWCAVADNVPAPAVMRVLFAHSAAILAEAGVRRMLCIVEPMHWLDPFLRESGFRQVDDVVTMIYRDGLGAPRVRPLPAGVAIRLAQPADLEGVCAADASAFEEMWRYPAFVLGRALETNACFTVAQQGDAIAGYLFAAHGGGEAHITRIAVRADLQGRGIGAGLLWDALEQLQYRFGVHTITLNTQGSNTVSQKLYRRFGFEPVQPATRVMQRVLAA
jgi:[ribosomal protein S18]-alanine N-acetyltransferase